MKPAWERIDWNSSLPKPPESVSKALAGIHPGLVIVGCDQELVQVAAYNYQPTANRRPRYHVLMEDEPGSGRLSYLFPVEEPPLISGTKLANPRKGEFMPCDQRLVQRIGTDISRELDSAKQIEDALQKAEADRKAALEKARSNELADFIAANESKIRNECLTDEGVNKPSGEDRDVTLYSFTGQAIRSTPGKVKASAKEAGWEVPDSWQDS